MIMHTEGKGDWTFAGCTTYVINMNYVTCVCNHLTNFACLVVNFQIQSLLNFIRL